MNRKKLSWILIGVLCLGLGLEEVKAEEGTELISEVENPMEITNYLQNGQKVMEVFNMQETSGDDIYQGDYGAEGFYYSAVGDSYYNMRNVKNQEITFYGVHLGESAEILWKALEENGWMKVYENLYTTMIGEERYAINIESDADGKIASWYMANYVEGLDLGAFWAKYEIEHSKDEWKKAYVSYIEKTEQSMDDPFSSTYSLIYVNDDEIPELLIDYGTIAGGGDLCTFDGEGIQTVHVYNYGVRYIEAENIVKELGGIQGVYFDNIYCIENGKFVLKHSGTYGMTSDAQWLTDEKGDPIYDYYKWDGQEVEKEEYQKCLSAVFDESREINPYEGGRMREEIVQAIRDIGIEEQNDEEKLSE